MKLKQSIAKILLLTAFAVPLRWQCEFPTQQFWWDIAWYTLVITMLIRPLSDLSPKLRPLKKWVSLRKELGILSAVIVVTAMGFSAYEWKAYFWQQFFSLDYWNPAKPFALGHLAQIVAIPLLVTSNKLSMRLLKKWWKPIQRLSYAYLYLTAFYLYKEFHKTDVLVTVILITVITISAYFINKKKRSASQQTK